MEHVPGFFKTVKITEPVRVKPGRIGSNIEEVVMDMIRASRSGTCAPQGFVMPGTIVLREVGNGRVDAASLNGDVSYAVTYTATVCNPQEGMTVDAKVVSTNTFGLFAQAVVDQVTLDIVVARRHQLAAAADRPDLPSIAEDAVGVGSIVRVEITRRRFELNERTISCIGIVVPAHQGSRPAQSDVNEVKDGGGVESGDDDYLEGGASTGSAASSTSSGSHNGDSDEDDKEDGGTSQAETDMDGSTSDEDSIAEVPVQKDVPKDGSSSGDDTEGSLSEDDTTDAASMGGGSCDSFGDD
jgi:DNA-directed RNA polymerase subunit E'/Rpb7